MSKSEREYLGTMKSSLGTCRTECFLEAWVRWHTMGACNCTSNNVFCVYVDRLLLICCWFLIGMSTSTCLPSNYLKTPSKYLQKSSKHVPKTSPKTFKKNSVFQKPPQTSPKHGRWSGKYKFVLGGVAHVFKKLIIGDDAQGFLFEWIMVCLDLFIPIGTLNDLKLKLRT